MLPVGKHEHMKKNSRDCDIGGDEEARLTEVQPPPVFRSGSLSCAGLRKVEAGSEQSCGGEKQVL